MGLVLIVSVAFSVLGMQSRDASPPGLVDGQLMACESKPNCVNSTYTGDEQHEIKPLPFVEAGADATWTRLVASVTQLGGDVYENAPPYLAATFKSSVFGFVDDVEFLINEASETVHVRSSSRVGYSDWGVNRKRVERIRRLLISQTRE